MSRPKATTATVVLTLRYQDAPKAIDWLCRAFGFEKQLVVPGQAPSPTRSFLDITDQDYGGRDDTCRDLEGHVWTFGTYDPWAEA